MVGSDSMVCAIFNFMPACLLSKMTGLGNLFLDLTGTNYLSPTCVHLKACRHVSELTSCIDAGRCIFQQRIQF